MADGAPKPLHYYPNWLGNEVEACIPAYAAAPRLVCYTDGRAFWQLACNAECHILLPTTLVLI